MASDGRGGWRPCAARLSGRRAVALEPAGPVTRELAPLPRLTVAFSLAKGERSEWAAAKLAELGVDRIIPLVCARTVVRPDDDSGHRSRRLGRIVREAAMQARLVHLPELGPTTSFADLVGAETGRACLADPGGGAPSLAEPVVLVGPEGGWEEAELAGAAAQGARTVTLSDHVLRVETAAVAAGVLLTALRRGLVVADDH